ncbi:hypothetical protein MesoLjLc_18560 [Mesorhizobium sp. L-8-10]|uniref:GDCCVxC domain-containing (seleno)protein n=1 Tax=unclassified Mesorhizobium TaxID=325217 RepID=UPI00193639A5|nr:hypothetical protein MesoLjLb_18980 [Mesorhizobium sp. L-8-3]BCH29926.1 hypothetical protein MesoLjLc_18560 [Mesorhizobium sp. L-8-10]
MSDRVPVVSGTIRDPDVSGRGTDHMTVLRSTITCPGCGHRETETMPINACRFLYDCKGCGALLHRCAAAQIFVERRNREHDNGEGQDRLAPSRLSIMPSLAIAQAGRNRPVAPRQHQCDRMSSP